MGRLFRLLKADETDVKVKQVKEKGAVALIYKTSRVDMDILDETLGEENWTTDYKEIKGVLYCGIGIRKNNNDPFVWKWDCGIESREDEEGNEKKGEASDAFKRAGFKVGIGRELYSSPFIFLNVETVADGKKYKLKNPFASYEVSHIAYDANDKISELTIVSDKGEKVFEYPKKYGNTAKKEQQQEAVKQQPLPATQPTRETPKTAPKTNDKKQNDGELTMSELVSVWGVKNPEETMLWLEKRIGVYRDEWTLEEHKLARDFVKIGYEKRKAEAAKIRQALQNAGGEVPFEDVE